MGSGFTPGGEVRGVIPEVMQELFARVAAGKDGIEFCVRVSFVEIHKEEVRDLLFVEGRGARPQVGGPAGDGAGGRLRSVGEIEGVRAVCTYD
jgi:hypothetical protein